VPCNDVDPKIPQHTPWPSLWSMRLSGEAEATSSKKWHALPMSTRGTMSLPAV